MQVQTRRDYFPGKTLLITGGTGLVGKALIEAILQRLPDIRKMYVMIRARKNAAGRVQLPEEVLRETVLSSSAFDGLRQRLGPDFDAFCAERIEAVQGNLAEKDLGMDPAVRSRLLAEVEVIINSAALAVFDAPFDDALQTNTLGPLRVLEFARAGARSPFIAHVSTCYVSNVAGPVFETPLDPGWTPAGNGRGTPYDVDTEIAAISKRIAKITSGESIFRERSQGAYPLDGNDDDGEPTKASDKPGSQDARIRRQLVETGLAWARRRGWKDTYTFSKAMGEQVFGRYKGTVPSLILRPSIIESALQAPAPGWIDGYRMLDPLIVGFARGQLPDFPGNPDAVIDVVPVDVVVNALLMAIPQAHAGKGAEVYHVSSGMERPLFAKNFHEYIVEYFEKTPLRRTKANGNPTRLKRLTFPKTADFLTRLNRRHLRPLNILEWIYRPLKVTKKGKKLHADILATRSRVERLYNTASIYGPYAENQARFLTFNLQSLWTQLTPEDQEAFPFLVQRFDWRRYVQEVHIPGIEHYLLRMSRIQPSGDLAQMCLRGPDLPESRLAGGSSERSILDDSDSSERWQRAARFMSLTRTMPPAEAQKWTTPADKLVLRRACLGLMRIACQKRLDLQCSGQQNVPLRGPVIVVSNHTSHVDTAVLLSALGAFAHHSHPTAATDYWFRNRMIAWLLHSLLGGIPFDRHAKNVPRAIALPAQVLRNGHSLIFYPEGTRSSSATMRPFRSTVGLLALASAAPILPAYITGADRALPKGSRSVRHYPVHVKFGDRMPIEPYLNRLNRESAAAVARALAEDVHAAVARLAGRLPHPAPEVSPAAVHAVTASSNSDAN